MIIKCISNSDKTLGPKLSKYAWPRDDERNLDISVGKHYIVYGIEENKLGTYYLVHTDTMCTESYWRMPAILYKITDPTKPVKWVIHEHANTKGNYLETFDSYFKWDIANGIEDGEPVALDTFNAQVETDTTMPTADDLNLLNKRHDILVAKKEYEAALKLARERGYERPEPPVDYIRDTLDQ
jgi:hypothetical protein